MTTSPLLLNPSQSRFRWVMLALCSLTPPLVITLPNLSLPPMFAMIGQDLNLTLVEVGTVWGISSFAGIFFALVGGTLGDRFGTRRTLLISCLLSGLFGLSRCVAVDFPTILISSLLYGFAQAVIPVLLFKVIRQWFPSEQLGMASGVISAGFAAGLMLGPLLSTSVILPLFGGWRQALLLYGIVSVGVGLLWLIIHPAEQSEMGANPNRIALRQSLGHVIRLRGVWVLGLAGLGMMGCFQGFTGYLPTYLKAVGWAELDADRALAAFFAASLTGVVPLSILSDRLRIRRGFLAGATLLLGSGIGSLAFINNAYVIPVIAVTGLVFDAYMAIYNASLLEVEGVGYLYAGTTLGFATMIRNLGGAIAPPLGNSLAVYGPSVPFILWGGMGLVAMLMYSFVMRSPKRKHKLDGAIA